MIDEKKTKAYNDRVIAEISYNNRNKGSWKTGKNSWN